MRRDPYDALHFSRQLERGEIRGHPVAHDIVESSANLRESKERGYCGEPNESRYSKEGDEKSSTNAYV